MKKTVAKNFLSLTFAEVVTRILGFALTIFIARSLGASGLGQFSFAMAFLAYFTFFTDLGLTMIGTREIAASPEESSKIGTSVLFIQTSLAVFLTVVILLLVQFLNIDDKSRNLIRILSFGLIPFALNINYIFQAKQKMEYVGLVKTIIQLTYFLISFIFIFLYKDIVFAAIGNVIGNLIGALLSIVLVVRLFKFKFSKIDLKFSKKLAIQALPLGISALLVQFFFNFDTVWIGLTRTVAEVGIYNAAYKFLLVLNSFGYYYFGALFPIFAEKYQRSEFSEIEKIGNASLQVLFFITFPIIAGIAVTAPNFLPKLLGSQFHSSVLILQILVLNIVFLWINNLLGSLLIAEKRQKLELVGVAAGSIANIILNIILIPKFGIIAAAFVSIVSQIITFSLAYYFVNRTVKLNMIINSYKSILNSLIMIIFLFIVFRKPNLSFLELISEIILGIVVYGALSVITKNIPPQFIKEYKRKIL